jgi:hypothetical protein
MKNTTKHADLIEIVKNLAAETPKCKEHFFRYGTDKDMEPFIRQQTEDYRKDFKEIFEKESEGY